VLGGREHAVKRDDVGVNYCSSKHQRHGKEQHVLLFERKLPKSLERGGWVRQSARAMLGESVPALAPAHAACAPAHALHAAKVQLQAVCGGGSLAEEAASGTRAAAAAGGNCCTPNGTPSGASAHSTKSMQRLLERSSMQKVFNLRGSIQTSAIDASAAPKPDASGDCTRLLTNNVALFRL
jgi:hypothetical protein